MKCEYCENEGIVVIREVIADKKVKVCDACLEKAYGMETVYINERVTFRRKRAKDANEAVKLIEKIGESYENRRIL